MYCRRFVILAVVMLLAGMCGADGNPEALFTEDPISINVSLSGGVWQGLKQVDFEGDTNDYLVEICDGPESGSIDCTVTGIWHGVKDDWEVFTDVASDSVVCGVKVTQETTSDSFYLFLYHDVDGDGEWSTGEPCLHAVLVSTF